MNPILKEKTSNSNSDWSFVFKRLHFKIFPILKERNIDVNI